MAIAVGVLLLALVYWMLLRQWFFTWGSTTIERTRPMPGDRRVIAPNYATTLAITIDAGPEFIWPWLVQMGYKRGGLYSYDWLDRMFGYLDRPSAERLLPEFQRLAVGDEIPIGRASGFPVVAIEPNRALVLGGQDRHVQWVWSFGLYPTGTGQTRLISRNRGRLPHGVTSWIIARVLEPAAFLMTRRMLIGIKRRAEGLIVPTSMASVHVA